MSKKLGELGEHWAKDFFARKGYTILVQNYQHRLGEIDLIALDQQTIVFIEVKTRRSLRHGSPLESITPQKQRKIWHMAQSFLKEHRCLSRPCRFDALGILVDDLDNPPVMHHVSNAFEAG